MASKKNRPFVPRVLEHNTLMLGGMDQLLYDVRKLTKLVKATGNSMGGSPSQPDVWPPAGTGTNFTEKFARIVENKKDSSGAKWGGVTDVALDETAKITTFLLTQVKVSPPTSAPAALANSLLADIQQLVAGDAVTIDVSGQQPESVQFYGGWPSDSTKDYWEIVVALGILLRQMAVGSGGGGKQLPPP